MERPRGGMPAPSGFSVRPTVISSRLLRRTFALGDGRTSPSSGTKAPSDPPTFIAFCATKRGDLDYGTPTLFTARSLDDKPLSQSSKMRIYHGFGDPRIRIGDKTFEVQREAVVSME